MLVLKFGGTSVADQAAVTRLVQIVRATAVDPPTSGGAQPDPRGPVVVCRVGVPLALLGLTLGPCRGPEGAREHGGCCLNGIGVGCHTKRAARHGEAYLGQESERGARRSGCLFWRKSLRGGSMPCCGRRTVHTAVAAD